MFAAVNKTNRCCFFRARKRTWSLSERRLRCHSMLLVLLGKHVERKILEETSFVFVRFYLTPGFNCFCFFLKCTLCLLLGRWRVLLNFTTGLLREYLVAPEPRVEVRSEVCNVQLQVLGSTLFPPQSSSELRLSRKHQSSCRH